MYLLGLICTIGISGKNHSPIYAVNNKCCKTNIRLTDHSYKFPFKTLFLTEIFSADKYILEPPWY